jgi:hypothetical protein
MDCGRIAFNSDFGFGSLSTVSAKSVGWLMSASVQNRRIPDPGQELRSRLNAGSMLLADRSYDADWIQRARYEQGRVEIDGPEVSCPSGKTPAQILHPACQSSPSKYIPLYRNSDLSYKQITLARDKGRIAIVTNRGLGCDGRDGVGRGEPCRAGNREQELSRRRHGADSAFAWLRA